ncbi:hypothetical protein V5H98_11630 [Georgenia sp. M64]|uniref:hypothetical protein n=1 Tax=Georgenia sp. M64 TaxID=3120520 RepID=UPI0030E517BA
MTTPDADRPTVRLTVGQALLRFLANQHTERDGVERPLVAGVMGIFGHGNVAGLGQALAENHLDPEPAERTVPYYLARNEQAMVHTAVGYARTGASAAVPARRGVHLPRRHRRPRRHPALPQLALAGHRERRSPAGVAAGHPP